jgi:phosphatidate cytidylyltransferase
MSVQSDVPGPWQVMFDRHLAIRAVSGVSLAVIAVGGAVLGGWWAAVMAAVFAATIHQEWTWLTEESRHPAIYYTAALVIAIAYVGAGLPQTGLALCAIAVAAAAVSSGSAYRPIGVAYAALFGLSVLLIRYSEPLGLSAILIVFVVVWGTDVFAFFAGKIIGGRRLWPVVSPNKTWAGAIGGLAGGIASGALAAALVGQPLGPGLFAVLAALALASEAGDLFESWVKRQMGEKDSGWLVPGHGGFMDRLDGLVFAAGLALLIGWLRGGPDAIAAGLVRW